MLTFVNRIRELQLFNGLRKKSRLIVLSGRRRVGKTRLLKHWISANNGFYSQCIESKTSLQLEQLYLDLSSALTTKIAPRSWDDFFQLLDTAGQGALVCIDEFPYLVASDPSLPSRLQRWLDHTQNKGVVLILAGSSCRMMHGVFLEEGAPLYGRADRIVHLQPMTYADFCSALKLDSECSDSFLKYSLVGGIPKYWELIDPAASALQIAEDLYFDFSPFMENEPRRILRDERLDDITPLSVLEAVGRGAERPSEIAGRLQTKQQNLSRVLQQLCETNLLRRDTPFGVSSRDAKHTLYRIADPAIHFWFRVYSPHRSLWPNYNEEQKSKLIWENAAHVFEDHCRSQFPSAARYWERKLEIDIIAPVDPAKKTVLVGEVKFTNLDKSARADVLAKLRQKWSASRCRQEFNAIEFHVYDLSALGKELQSRNGSHRKPPPSSGG